MFKVFQVKASDNGVLAIARLMGADPTRVAQRIEQAISASDFEDKESWLQAMEDHEEGENGNSIRTLIEFYGGDKLNIFSLAMKAQIPSFDVRMTDALADVKINTVGDCPECGENDMEDTEECEELNDGDYYTPNSKRELWRCPCCGHEEWNW